MWGTVGRFKGRPKIAQRTQLPGVLFKGKRGTPVSLLVSYRGVWFVWPYGLCFRFYILKWGYTALARWLSGWAPTYEAMDG